MTAIKLISETAETVTISRADWEALLNTLEDTEDLAAVQARRAEEAIRGKEAIRRSYLTAEEVERLWAGENPVKVWREKRRLSGQALAAQAGLPTKGLDLIESRATGEVGAEVIEKLAAVLQMPPEWLLSD